MSFIYNYVAGKEHSFQPTSHDRHLKYIMLKDIPAKHTLRNMQERKIISDKKHMYPVWLLVLQKRKTLFPLVTH